MVREIVYRILQDEPSGPLQAMAARNDQFMRIARIVQQIHVEFAKPLSVEDLAKRASMSISTFHHNFKAVTATSPLQYLKEIRLHRSPVDGACGAQRQHRRDRGRLRKSVPVWTRVQADVRSDTDRGACREDAAVRRDRGGKRHAPARSLDNDCASRNPRTVHAHVHGYIIKSNLCRTACRENNS